MHYDVFFDRYFKKIILIAAVLGPLILFSYFFYSNQGYWWDEAVYLGLAKNIYDGKGYYINAGQESFRAPLFPYLIYVLWKIFGVSESIVRLIPVLFALLSIPTTYFLAKKIYNKEIAVWASLILATTHMFLFYGLKLLTETIFMTFFALSLLLYYLGIEKNRKMLLLAGIVMALTFLTRYMGYVLPILYAIYPLTKKRKIAVQIFSNKFYWLGAFLFIVLLIPWFWMSYVNYGSPIEAMFVEGSTVTTGWYIEGWNYYFAHWIEIFGLVGLFAVPAIIYVIFKIREQGNAFLLLIISAIMIFFMTLPRKEMRYLISFLPTFAIFFALGAVELKKWLKKNLIIDVFVIVFCAINFVAGIQMIQYDMQGGYALKQAGLYLRSAVSPTDEIMSQNMPILFYTTGRQIVYFPVNENQLNETITKNNVKYIVIEKREPTYPSYVWSTKYSDKTPSQLFNMFKLEKTLQENNVTYVWIYST